MHIESAHTAIFTIDQIKTPFYAEKKKWADNADILWIKNAMLIPQPDFLFHLKLSMLWKHEKKYNYKCKKIGYF